MADKMNFSSTMLFTSEEIRREKLKQHLNSVSRSMEERGNNPIIIIMHVMKYSRLKDMRLSKSL